MQISDRGTSLFCGSHVLFVRSFWGRKAISHYEYVSSTCPVPRTGHGKSVADLATRDREARVPRAGRADHRAESSRPLGRSSGGQLFRCRAAQ